MRLLASHPAAGLAVRCGLFLTPLLLASSPDAQAGEAPTAREVSEAGALYRSSCASCHLPPDPEHATDRAWLTQVTDTA